MSSASTPRGTLHLGGDLTIREAMLLHERLLAALGAHGEIEIDCASDAEVDLSFIQLLIAAGKLAAAGGKRVALSAAARHVLHDTLARGGFLPAPGLGPTGENWLPGAAS